MSVGAYDQTQRELSGGRALEARALLRCAITLRDAFEAKDGPGLIDAVTKNCRLWLFFASEIQRGNVTLPQEVAINIVTLTNYIVNVAPRAMGGDAKVIDTLISINRNIAAGLSSGDEPAAAAAPPPAAAPMGAFSAEV